MSMSPTPAFGVFPRTRILTQSDVPLGFPRNTYEIEGFNTVYNPTARTFNGVRPQQSSLLIVFDSGLQGREPDGVSVQSLLEICEDHLNSKQLTLEGTDAHARASAYIRRAIYELTGQANGIDLPPDTKKAFSI